MTSPLVSVCLPNLNTRPYLQERIDTILSQTYSNWELVVSDNFSDDGSWEFLQSVAAQDSRVSIGQAPRAGLYPNWNNCLRRAKGKYVYIATSDDTMAADCLEKMVDALERHPTVDLAHCPLRTIGPRGEPVDDPKWPECTVFAHGTEEVLNRRHLRRAPFDGMLHLTGRMVYCSITELLIRRSLFDRIGFFESRWGSVGDFNWDMKAGLVANTIHVPDTWASYRVHQTQATAGVNFHSDKYAATIEEMVQDAFQTCERFLQPEVVSGLRKHWLPAASELRLYYAGLRNRRRAGDRRVFQAKQVLGGTGSTRKEIFRRLVGKPRWLDAAPGEIREWLESTAGPVITEV
jgi:glycosyltransferase involved in cell wall biosynthesis